MNNNIKRLITALLILIELGLAVIIIFACMDEFGLSEVVLEESNTVKNPTELMNTQNEIMEEAIAEVMKPKMVKVIEPILVEKVIEAAPVSIEDHIKLSCIKYEIPFDIVLAIARLETGWFTSNAYVNNNNPGGLSVDEVPMSFKTIDDGVEAFVSNLANNYFAIGLNTPELIGEKYCPVNPEWAGMVEMLIE